ncbi:uncharacterized protein LOC141835328 [Curcuma longa]|uniref:uncharacterized protein LOC141835328 n=1 Tax=Curcuma longa TaxID=136217 RepID=UPI003D9F196F
MSISIEHCYSRLELVRCLREAAIFLALLLKWLLLPSHAWWWLSPSPYSEDTAAAAKARACCRAAAVRAALRVATYGNLMEVEAAEEVRSTGVGVGVTCAVCLSEVAAGAAVWELTNCRHVFHKGCLDRWLDHDEHLSCPLCRAPLLPAQQPPPPLPPAELSWAVEHLLYLFGDDQLLAPPP